MTAALFGGVLIGLGAALLWFTEARVAGVSGLLHNALRGAGNPRLVSIAFLAGLVLAGLVADRRFVEGEMSTGREVLLGVGGVLAGFGARLGGGCTSGHGVCGVARLSRRSIVATVTFMATGFLTVFLVRHVLALSGVP